MTKIIFATGNENKMREIRQILGSDSIEIQSLKEAGLVCDAVEDGATFAENALIKARNVAAKAPGAIVMADDSGLEIDALGGEPGIYSARYMGEDTSYDIKNRELIHRLEGVPDESRTARFRCVIAAVLPDGNELTADGAIEGQIGYEQRGKNGFGYDPIFYIENMTVSTAELDPDAKNAISHRGRALRKMKELLEQRKESGAAMQNNTY